MHICSTTFSIKLLPRFSAHLKALPHLAACAPTSLWSTSRKVRQLSAAFAPTTAQIYAIPALPDPGENWPVPRVHTGFVPER